VNATTPEIRYEAYIIRPTKDGHTQVFGFKTWKAGQQAMCSMQSLYALEMPGGQLIGLVGNYESARALLPTNTRKVGWISTIELWERTPK